MLRIAGLVFVMVLVLESCWAQKGEGLPATTNIPGSEFPRINNDLSATFRVQADHAQKDPAQRPEGDSRLGRVPA